MQKEIILADRRVGDGHPVFIVFEAGPTHDGLPTAKALVRHAARAGADAVKFQIADPDRLVPDKGQRFEYETLLSNGQRKKATEPLYDILKRRSLAPSEWRELKAFCDELGLLFFSTATFEDEVDFLLDLGVPTVKICSGDIDHLPLIRYCAKKAMSVQLDTGNATIGEVEKAFDTVRETGNDKVIIHHCPSGYPARLESINLKVIPTLKQMFGCPVAFSDHSPGWNMDIAAIALGANMVEKTITLDRTTPGVEHMFSLEPDEMAEFVRSVRALETALGTSRKIVGPKERALSLGARRHLVLTRNVEKGEKADKCCIGFARPGNGLCPDEAGKILGRRFARAFCAGHCIDWRDFEND